MPKEVIDDYINGEFSVKVGWERDGYVQVATINPKREYRMSYEGDGEGQTFTAHGLYSTLDRDGINRLIQVLRRARDQAYGADQ